MKAMYKFEVAEAAGVSLKTLRHWISERISAGDNTFARYNKHCKILDGSQVQSLSEHYCIIFEK